jgi:hypothetical protein
MDSLCGNAVCGLALFQMREYGARTKACAEALFTGRRPPLGKGKIAAIAVGTRRERNIKYDEKMAPRTTRLFRMAAITVGKKYKGEEMSRDSVEELLSLVTGTSKPPKRRSKRRGDSGDDMVHIKMKSKTAIVIVAIVGLVLVLPTVIGAVFGFLGLALKIGAGVAIVALIVAAVCGVLS